MRNVNWLPLIILFGSFSIQGCGVPGMYGNEAVNPAMFSALGASNMTATGWPGETVWIPVHINLQEVSLQLSAITLYYNGAAYLPSVHLPESADREKYGHLQPWDLFDGGEFNMAGLIWHPTPAFHVTQGKVLSVKKDFDEIHSGLIRSIELSNQKQLSVKFPELRDFCSDPQMSQFFKDALSAPVVLDASGSSISAELFPNDRELNLLKQNFCATGPVRQAVSNENEALSAQKKSFASAMMKALSSSKSTGPIIQSAWAASNGNLKTVAGLDFEKLGVNGRDVALDFHKLDEEIGIKGLEQTPIQTATPLELVAISNDSEYQVNIEVYFTILAVSKTTGESTPYNFRMSVATATSSHFAHYAEFMSSRPIQLYRY